MKTSLIPYLSFNGNCEEALNFYQAVLGGEVEISRFSRFDSPQMPVPDAHKEKVMHGILRNDLMTIMASDGAPGHEISFGDSISMSIAGSDGAQVKDFFNGLSEGGTVTMPLKKQIWGDTFGMFTDKFGIHWMMNITTS